MKTKQLFQLPVNFLLVALLMLSNSKLSAQQDVNRRLNNAINGFDFNETAARKAIADGGNINWVNDALGGETLLITAIKGFKEPKVIRFLLENGADKKIKDNSGKTALDWAEQYGIGKNNNGREILKLLGSAAGTPAANQQGTTQGNPATTNTQNQTTVGGPSISEIKQTVEKKLTRAHEDHFFGVKNKVTFEWTGGIIVGQPENRLRLAQSCYPAKLNVKVTITDPRDGNTSTLTRGTEASIGGYHKTEIFCFFKDGFGKWDFGTYEQ